MDETADRQHLAEDIHGLEARLPQAEDPRQLYRQVLERSRQVGLRYPSDGDLIGVLARAVTDAAPQRSLDRRLLADQLQEAIRGTPKRWMEQLIAERLQELDRAKTQEREERWRNERIAAGEDPDWMPPPEPVTRFGHEAVLELFDGGKGYVSTLSDTYRWVGSHYEKEDEADLLRCISTYATTKIVQTKAGPKTNFATSSFIQEALKMLRLMTRINPACLNPGGYINCRNGVLRLQWQHGSLRRELLPHTPDLVFTSPPACAYEPEACRDHLDRMLACLDPQQRELWLDVAGASFAVAEVRRLHGRIPAVFQLGQGSNGKDTLNSCLQALHGEGAVARVTISDFRGFDAGSGAGRFKVQNLAGARLNIASENSAGFKVENCESFKNAISGDILVVEGKHEKPYAITPVAVMFFNFNKQPLIDATTEAILSRVLPISFNRTYSSEPRAGELLADPRFKEDWDWMAEHVLPAFLNALLDGLERVLQRGFRREASRPTLERLQRDSTHLWDLIEGLGLEAGGDDERIQPKDLIEEVHAWYEQEQILSWDVRHDRDGLELSRRPIWPLDWPKGDPLIKRPRDLFDRLRRCFPKLSRASGKGGVTWLVGLRQRTAAISARSEKGTLRVTLKPKPGQGGDPEKVDLPLTIHASDRMQRMELEVLAAEWVSDGAADKGLMQAAAPPPRCANGLRVTLRVSPSSGGYHQSGHTARPAASASAPRPGRMPGPESADFAVGDVVEKYSGAEDRWLSGWTVLEADGSRLVVGNGIGRVEVFPSELRHCGRAA